MKTLDALGITPLLSHGTSISQIAGYEKPDSRIFEAACHAAGIEPEVTESDIHRPEGNGKEPREFPGVLMIGDEVEA